jgi:hypothetical protein
VLVIEEMTAEKLNLQPNDIVVLKFKIGESKLEDVALAYKTISEKLPEQKVFALDETMDLYTVDKETFKNTLKVILKELESV